MAVMLRQQFKYNILSIVIFGGGRKIGSIRFTYLVVVSRRWMLVESMGVASGCTCSCKEVYRFPHNYYLFLYTALVSVLFCSSIPNCFKCV